MTNKNKLSRREAIKILGTATGASLLANIPAKWSRPEVTGSPLPAFAQTSGNRFIASCADFNDPPHDVLLNTFAHVIFTAVGPPNTNIPFNLTPVQLTITSSPQSVMSNSFGDVSLTTQVQFNGGESFPMITNQFSVPGVECGAATVNFFVTDLV